jgi:hypothetical protein
MKDDKMLLSDGVNLCLSESEVVSDLEKGLCKRWMRYHREYTLTCEKDYLNICEGLCPDYALSWSDEHNELYWNEGEDYKGDIKKRIDQEYLSYILNEKMKRKGDCHFESREKNNEISLLQSSKKVCFDIFSEVVVFDENLSCKEGLFD